MLKNKLVYLLRIILFCMCFLLLMNVITEPVKSVPEKHNKEVELDVATENSRTSPNSEYLNNNTEKYSSAIKGYFWQLAGSLFHRANLDKTKGQTKDDTEHTNRDVINDDFLTEENKLAADIYRNEAHKATFESRGIYNRTFKSERTVVREPNFSHGVDSDNALNQSVFDLENNCLKTVQENLYQRIDSKLIQQISEGCMIKGTLEDSEIFQTNFTKHVLKTLQCEIIRPQFLQENTPRLLVALASFPGSGNSWVRQILEALTGIYTGSIYNDFMAAFKGSKRCPTNGETFIIKTHRSNTGANRRQCPRSMNYTKAIFILRNPFHALMAEFNRVHGGKVGFAMESQYESDKWSRFVVSWSKHWEKMVRFWLTEFDGPLHLLIYERLKAQTSTESFRMMQFLGMPVTLKTLYCLVDDRTHDKYYRREKPPWLTPDIIYTGSLKQIVNSVIENVSHFMDSKPYVKEIIKSYRL